ncbi:MAG: hypothetical protein PVI90_17145 [Desulfobacteraceae bacterium]|jgi:uncharacterized membrane protein
MQFIFEIIKEMLTAWRIGQRLVRSVIATAIILVILAMIVAIMGKFFPYSHYIQSVSEGIATVLGVIAGALALSITAYQKSNEETKREERILEAEKRVQDNPKETQAAWELARVKLESYLNRNLNQVRSIFYLTVFVMLVGFTLIGYGVFKIYENPETFNASILATVSGIIVNCIGATFLILYKSTMAQATDYVKILERINAVGMSVQILETVEDEETKLKQQATADLAKQLLALYTEKRQET